MQETQYMGVIRLTSPQLYSTATSLSRETKVEYSFLHLRNTSTPGQSIYHHYNLQVFGIELVTALVSPVIVLDYCSRVTVFKLVDSDVMAKLRPKVILALTSNLGHNILK